MFKLNHIYTLKDQYKDTKAKTKIVIAIIFMIDDSKVSLANRTRLQNSLKTSDLSFCAINVCEKGSVVNNDSRILIDAIASVYFDEVEPFKVGEKYSLKEDQIEKFDFTPEILQHWTQGEEESFSFTVKSVDNESVTSVEYQDGAVSCFDRSLFDLVS